MVEFDVKILSLRLRWTNKKNWRKDKKGGRYEVREREINKWMAEALHQTEILMTKLCFFDCCCCFFFVYLPIFSVDHLRFSNMHIQQTKRPSSIYRWKNICRWWRNHIEDFHRNENYLMLGSVKCHLCFSVILCNHKLWFYVNVDLLFGSDD